METRLTPDMIATLQRTLANGVASAPASAAGTQGPSFAAALGDALKSVSQAQQQSGDLQRRFQAGADGVSLEETMISMQKAQIGFQAVLAVRNRLVSAYTDIMNMQV
jgi:flagellar hook-basal body complex protein FliE